MSRKEVQGKKMCLLDFIEARKTLLFGKFSKEVSSAIKEQCWEEVLEKAKSLGLADEHRTWTYARDSLWGCWKSRTLIKQYKAKSEGDEKFLEIDEKIISILDSMPDNDSSEHPCLSESPTSEMNGATQQRVTEAEDSRKKRPVVLLAAYAEASKPQKKKRLLESSLEDLEKRKLRKELEIKDLEKYDLQLQCTKRELELGLPASPFTADIRSKIDQEHHTVRDEYYVEETTCGH